MAELNLDYHDGNDIYNDGDVEQLLLNYYKNGTEIDYKKDNIFYLTTDVRNNILNWYPFTNQDSVLEIGCGCGTLTGKLCEKCKNVVAVEGSKRRAEITYYRHKDSKNLKIYAGNFDDIKIEEKFDYIVLIGVFEYAKLFFDSDTPFDDFLSKIKKLLKPTGKVLLAIENRYGIKYWAGANEDHIAKPYVGLEGYDSYNVQTFGKVEFIKMIEKHGFTKNKFYYPFPDYKLPTIIYTDDRLPKENEISSIPIYSYGNKINFNIAETLRGLIKNDSFGFFSNSFLIEFGFDKSKLSDIIYVKNLDYRNVNFKTITIENSKHEFIKVPDNEKAKEHLDNVVKIHEEVKKNNIKICGIEEKNGKYLIERIIGNNVAEYIQELSLKKEWDLVTKEIDNLVSFYNSISKKEMLTNPIISEAKKVYKNKTNILKISLIDGNVSNIIRNKNGEYIFIDQEWVSDKQLPTEYLIFYSLSYIFGTNSLLSNHISFEEICKKYNISNNKIRLFYKIEKYYFTELNQVIDENKKNILDCCKAPKDSSDNEIFTVLYYDDGSDFCEESKIVTKYIKGNNENEFIVNFDLPKNILRVRFDPIISGNKFINFSDIKVNGKKITYDEYNVDSFNNKKNLLLEHPFIVFPFDKQKLEISILLEKFSVDEEKLYIQNSIDLKHDYVELSNEKRELEQKLETIKNNKWWKLLEKVRKLKK